MKLCKWIGHNWLAPITISSGLCFICKRCNAEFSIESEIVDLFGMKLLKFEWPSRWKVIK